MMNELQEYLNEGLVWNKNNLIGIFGMKILKLGFGFVVSECRNSFIKFADHMEYYRIKNDTLMAINRLFSKSYKQFDPIIRAKVEIEWSDDVNEAFSLEKTIIIFNKTLKILNAINKLYPITNLIYKLLTMSGAPKQYFKENKKIAIGAILWLLLVHGQFNRIAADYGLTIKTQTKMDTILNTTREFRKWEEDTVRRNKEKSLEKSDVETEEDVKKKFKDEEQEEEFEEILRKHKEQMDKSNNEIDRTVKKNKQISSHSVHTRMFVNKYLKGKSNARRN